jgi:hypothetical protein
LLHIQRGKKASTVLGSKSFTSAMEDRNGRSPMENRTKKKTSIYVSPSSGSQICYRFGFQQMSMRIEEEEEDSSSKAHLK